MTENTQKIYALIEKYEPVRAVDLTKIADLSNKNLYKHLSILLDKGLISKAGSTPRVYYSTSSTPDTYVDSLDPTDLLIEHNYIFVSPEGKMYRGVRGFNLWCNRNNLNIPHEKQSYSTSLLSIGDFKENGLISAKDRILSGSCSTSLDDIFFNDFYTFGHFGKTKLGQLLYVGKSSQDKETIAEIASIIKQPLLKLIKAKNIKQIGFIPPTIDRKVQVLDVLKDKLNIPLPEVQIEKVKRNTIVAQKSLRKLEDRIRNAQENISVNPAQELKSSILLIDDATGSGATLNQTAAKIKVIAGDKIKVYGYSIVGSYKGFDVISEV